MKIKIANKITLILSTALIIINILYPTITKGVNLDDKKNIGNLTQNVTNTENELYNIQQEQNVENNQTQPQAESSIPQNTQEFYLSSIGMRIYIDKDLIEIISGLENGDERLNSLENKEEYLELFRKNGILLDAVDKLGDEATKEIMVLETTNASYMLMQNLNSMEENEIQAYFQAFVNSIQSDAQNSSSRNGNSGSSDQENSNSGSSDQSNSNSEGSEQKSSNSRSSDQANSSSENSGQKDANSQNAGSGEVNITNSNLLKTANGNVYFHITAETIVEEKNVKLSLYYTIMNQRLITISNRYIESEIDETAENALIENITIDSLPRNTEIEWQIRLTNYLSVGVVILIGIVILLIRRRDKKKLDKTIENKTIKSYKQFGGILILFWLICIFQIIMTSLDLLGVKSLTTINFQIITIIVQDIAILLINIYMLIKELKIDKETPKKLTKALIIVGAITIILTIARNIYIGITTQNISIPNLILQTFYSIFSNSMYVIILAGYLHFSQRVKIYYGISDKIEYITINTFKEKIKEKWQNRKNRSTKKNKEEKKN